MQIVQGKNSTTKAMIEAIVQRYVMENPAEYVTFQAYMSSRRSTLVTDFAEIKGQGMDVMERAIHEIPATLQLMFTKELPLEDEKWLQTKEGARWFAKKFPVFASGNKV